MKKQLLLLPTLPNSRVEPLVIASPHNGRYNCIAWVLGITDTNFWPLEDDRFEGPDNLPFLHRTEVIVRFSKNMALRSAKAAKRKEASRKSPFSRKKGSQRTLAAC